MEDDPIMVTDSPDVSESNDSPDEVTEVETGTDLSVDIESPVVENGDVEDSTVIDVDAPDVDVNVTIVEPESDNDSGADDILAIVNRNHDEVMGTLRDIATHIVGLTVVQAETAAVVEEVIEDAEVVDIAEEVIADSIEPDEPPETTQRHWFFR